MRYIFLCTGCAPSTSGMWCESPNPLSGGYFAGNSSGKTSAYSSSNRDKASLTSSSAVSKCGTAPLGYSALPYNKSYKNNNGEPDFFNSTEKSRNFYTLLLSTTKPFHITLSHSMLRTAFTCYIFLQTNVLPTNKVLSTRNTFLNTLISFTKILFFINIYVRLPRSVDP